MPDALPIAETFISIQGEGSLTGVPSWFCRTAGCNLRCRWCDTPYASWSPEGKTRTVNALFAEARASGVRHAVLTGGEPMLFPAIEDLTQRLQSAHMHVTIETAGTVDRALSCDLISVSPKLANSTPTDDPRDPLGIWAKRHEARRFDPQTLRSVLTRGRTRQVKFVIADPRDVGEIDEILAQVGIDPGEVMLMPEGITTPEPGRVRWIVDLCVSRGWRYCPRVHIEVFGNVRGT